MRSFLILIALGGGGGHDHQPDAAVQIDASTLDCTTYCNKILP